MVLILDHFHVKPPEPLQEQHSRSNEKIILKNHESIYCKQTNNKNLQNMKVLQIDQQENPTQYEGIANKLAREL